MFTISTLLFMSCTCHTIDHIYYLCMLITCELFKFRLYCGILIQYDISVNVCEYNEFFMNQILMDKDGISGVF